MTRRIFIVLALLWGASTVSSYAAVYEWVDDKGISNFTDDLDKVPAKYRQKMKKQELDTRGEVRAPSVQQPVEQVSLPPVSPELPGGHDQAWWNSQFNAIKGEMKVISDNLPQKRDRLAVLRHKRVVFQRGSDRKAYFDLSSEIERDEARLKELQESLAGLEAEADRLAVPKEWR